MIKNDEIDFIVNTSKGKKAVKDALSLRRNALLHKVSYTTTIAGAKAVCMALKCGDTLTVTKLQELYTSRN
jgi:carbamoyl-phosphate synthase large subunit